MESNSRIGYLMEELKLELSRSSQKYELIIENLQIENSKLKDNLSQTSDKINLLHQQMNAIQQENSSLRNQKQKLKHCVLKVKQKQKMKKDNLLLNGSKCNDETERGALLLTSPEVITNGHPMHNDYTQQANHSTIVSSEDSSTLDSNNNDSILNPIAINIVTLPLQANVKTLPEPICSSEDSAMKSVQRIITEQKEKLNIKENIKKQEFRKRLPTKVCEQCQAYFGNDSERINHTCRHRYGGNSHSTPEGYWDTGRPTRCLKTKEINSKKLFT